MSKRRARQRENRKRGRVEAALDRCNSFGHADETAQRAVHNLIRAKTADRA